MSTSTLAQSTPKRVQTYFHQERSFDYEKFISSVAALTLPIVQDDNLRYLSMFICKDDYNRPYAQYKIGEDSNLRIDFPEEVKFLESYKLFLNDAENKNFAVYGIFNHFLSLDPDHKTEWPLGKQSLSTYFQQGKTNKKRISLKKPLKHDLDTFIRVEELFVNYLLSGLQDQEGLEESSYFLPLPIIAYGNPVGVIYFIYNENKIRAKRTGGEVDLKDYYRSWLLQVTRGYEQISTEGVFEVYTSKPGDPLDNYFEVFSDLNQFYYEQAGTKKQEGLKEIKYKHKSIKPRGEPSRVITQNPFLVGLGYDGYYPSLAKALIKDAEQLLKTKDDRIRTSITSIIVDSFAHNIGAHSLVALKWWFEKRFRTAAKLFNVNHSLVTGIEPKNIFQETVTRLKSTIEFHSFMDDFEHEIKTDKMSLVNLIRFMEEDTINALWKFRDKNSQNPQQVITAFPVPIVQSVYHLFQYLRDKSAFWSGVTRDKLFGGQFRSWGRILRTFLNNTLFLGTIAHSEGIKKIFVHVEILEEAEDGGLEVKIGGEYAQINLEVMEIEKEIDLKWTKGVFLKDDQGYSPYAFLRKGNDFDKVHKSLMELPHVFLPNGIIGQHALYTLFENTLRNIKHYKPILDDLSQEGVKFCISIQRVGLLKRLDDTVEEYQENIENFETIDKYQTTQKCMYKVGAWLHHPQKLYSDIGAQIEGEKEPFHPKSSVIDSHTQQLKKRIVDEFGQPTLGGSAQDKVCAAMLMNGRFSSIDEMDLNIVKRQYYPYVMAGSELYESLDEAPRIKGFRPNETILHKAYNPDLIGRTEMDRKEKYKQTVIRYVDEVSTNKEKGIIKKYFHVWQGDKCIVANEKFYGRHENAARFKVLALHKTKTSGLDLEHFRDIGIIRIVDFDNEWETLNQQALFEKAMIKWLGQWLGGNREKIGLILFKQGKPNKKQGDQDEEGEPVWRLNLIQTGKEWSLEILPEWDLKIDDVYHDLGLVNNGKSARISLKKLHKASNELFQSLVIKHSSAIQASKYVCNLRSHTSFFGYLFEKSKFGNFMEKEFDHEKDNPLKLLETVMTHITIFDARVYERLGIQNEDEANVFKDQLRIKAFPELPKKFREHREEMLSKTGHFIIVHLSFLEAIYRSNDDGGVSKDGGRKIPYKEKEVEEFFIKEIVRFFPGEKFPPNIILVITSGRGRGDWFKAINHPQITFRPIEALLGGIEDGLSLKDDFQVKFNLCNVLFGS